MNNDSRKTIGATFAVCCSLVVIVAAVFGQTVGFDFVNFDDAVYVADNPNMAEGLTTNTVATSFTGFCVGNWHPVTLLSHALDSQIYGSRFPAGHHLTNVALHAAVAVALFLVLLRMTGSFWPSAFVAAVFAVHPLRVESVAWVSERKDVLSGLFFMLTLAAYLGYVRHPNSRARYALIFVPFILGLMSKPMLVTLPFVLLLLDYWPLRRWPATSDSNQSPSSDRVAVGRLILEKVPLLAIAGASCAITMVAQQCAIITFEVSPLQLRLGNALVSYVAYVASFLCPTGLTLLYPFPTEALPLWKVAAAAAALVGVSLAAVWGRRRFPYLFVGWFWYVGMMVPVIGLVQVGAQAMADRYTYLPQIGLCIAIAWGAADVAAAWPYRRWAYGIASALIVATLMGCAYQQTTYWRNSRTLWTRVLACTEDNVIAHNNLGMAMTAADTPDKALGELRQATAISPKYARTNRNLVAALKAHGREKEAEAYIKKIEESPHREAVAYYREALAAHPNDAHLHFKLANALTASNQTEEAIAEYRKALELNDNLAAVHNNLANLLARTGHPDEALAEYRKAVALDPRSANAHNNIATILAQRGNADAAIAEFQKALKIDPTLTTTHDNLGLLLYRQNRMAEAAIEWQEVVRREPDNARALNQLAWLLATCPDPSVRNPKAAIELAQWAVKITRKVEPIPLNTLAAAYAQDGQFSDAATAAREALVIAKKQKNDGLADLIRRCLALYEANKAYVESPLPAAANPSP